jgi:hypothetical protein
MNLEMKAEEDNRFSSFGYGLLGVHEIVYLCGVSDSGSAMF